MNTGFLSNDTVVLRGLRRSDLEAHRAWLDNPEVTRYLENGWKPASDADLDAIYDQAAQSNDTVLLVIEDAKQNQAVGTVGLYLINWPGRRAQFRILIGEPAAWDRGLGTAATKLIVAHGFERLNLETIYLGVNADNERAVRAYEKAGFSHEGVQRHFVYNGGRYFDVAMMSILRNEYFAAAGGPTGGAAG